MKIVGSKGFADSLFGGKSSDLIFGDDGNDLISAWSEIGQGAKDKVNAGAGDDLISGFSVDLTRLTRSESRGSAVDGGTGYDMLIIDTVSASKNTTLDKLEKVMNVSKVEEVIYNVSAATGKQSITGTNANETIYIGEGGSTAVGGGGNDYLFAGVGDDKLVGGTGNDFLSGGDGRNTLTGGAGADYFMFHLTDGYSYSDITDFQKGVDKIALILDIGGEFTPDSFGDGLRFIDREMDVMGYLNYDKGRIVDRSLFSNDATFYADNMVYEQSTGSFMQHVYLDDGNGGTLEYDVALAQIRGAPNLDASDFVFFVL